MIAIYLLTKLCFPQIHPQSTFTVTRGHVWPMVKSVSRPMHVSPPSLSEATRCLPAPLSFYQQVFYSRSLQCQSPHFLMFVGLLLVISLTRSPKHSADMWSSIPKHKKAAMCLTKKTCMLDKLPLGLSSIAILAVSSMSMNQPRVLNKLSLKIKQGYLCIDILPKML